MAYITTSTADSGVFASLRNFFFGFRSALGERAEYNRTFRQLSRLSNRELADIGLSRDDIASACAGRIG